MSDLIYDVGMHNGDDTRYYLDKGFRVVGIEANPTFCRACETRFAPEVAQGRLTILSIGVGEAVGQFDFYINERETQISSFRPIEGDLGPWSKIRVETDLLSSIIKRHGDPFFIKIDVEHLDHLVLRDLRNNGIVPSFISAEAHLVETFEELVRLGYRKFKVLPGEAVSQQYSECRIKLRDGDVIPYSFPRLSSGPFGDDLAGSWLDVEAASAELARIGLGWIDVHACRDE